MSGLQIIAANSINVENNSISFMVSALELLHACNLDNSNTDIDRCLS